jgi:hypothetical protein
MLTYLAAEGAPGLAFETEESTNQKDISCGQKPNSVTVWMSPLPGLKNETGGTHFNRTPFINHTATI